jgi:acetolactate synthase-1/2/3 large subunit
LRRAAGRRRPFRRPGDRQSPHFGEVPRKIIHIDIDPSSISKRVKVDVPIVGNVPDVLDECTSCSMLPTPSPDAKALAAWWKQIDEWRGKKC